MGITPSKVSNETPASTKHYDAYGREVTAAGVGVRSVPRLKDAPATWAEEVRRNRSEEVVDEYCVTSGSRWRWR